MTLTSKSNRISEPNALKEDAQKLRLAGKWKELMEFLGSVEPSLSGSEPDLLLLRAEAALRLGEAHQAVQLSNSLLGQERLPSALRARALLIRSSASRLRGFPDQSILDATTAIALIEDGPSPVELRIEGHRQLGINFGTAGEMEEAIQHLEQALDLCARASDLSQLASVHAALGVALGSFGRLTQALVHLNHARAATEKLGDKVQLSDILNNLGHLSYLLGEYDAALGLLEKARELAVETGYCRTEAMALITMGHTLLQKGELDEALVAYADALRSADDAFEPRLTCCANMGLGGVYCEMHDFKKAQIFLEQAAYDAERLHLTYELATAKIERGVLECALDNDVKARENLKRGIDLLQQTGSPAGLVKGHLYLGLTHFKSKRWTMLNDSLTTVSRLVDQLDLKWELIREGKAVLPVIDYAASKRIGGSLFADVRAQLQNGQSARVAEPALSKEAPVTGNSTYPRLEVHSLGKPEVLIDGRRISDTEWESQKAKELFFYLLCNRSGKRREQLLEVLWPDISSNLSRNAFYNNVYRARRALYKESIVQDGGLYQLNPEGAVWFDLDEFQRLVNEAERFPRGSEERASLLSGAIQVYRGGFLDEFYSEWSDTIRLEAEAQYLRSLARLAGYHAARGEYDTAIPLLEQLLLVDDTDFAAHEQLVKALLRKGDITQAKQRHKFYVQLASDKSAHDSPKSFADLCKEVGVAA